MTYYNVFPPNLPPLAIHYVSSMTIEFLIIGLTVPVKELENKYVQLSEALSEKLQALDAALVQSQGLQDALDSLLQWLNTIESQLK